MLTENQIKQYQEDGFVILPELLSDHEVQALRDKTEALCQNAAGLHCGNDVYDLEDSHQPNAPRVRRIKAPHLVDEIYASLIRDERVLGPLKQLLGSSVRLLNTKLNLKSKGYGAPVEWHQDWAFYPHSNDDVLAVGVFLNDVSADNGPLNFIPGSHRGPLFDHHDNGYFCGIADLEAEKVDVSDATPGIAPAGSVSIHHARTLHGSEANQSNEDRGLLLYEVAAGDAWPLAGGLGKPFTDLNEFNARLLCGEPVVTPRLANVPVRMPLPIHAGATSIYQLQEESGRRFYAEKMRAN